MDREIAFQDQIKKLNIIGIALSSETNVKVLLGMILKEARNFTNADAGSLYIKEDGKLYFEVTQNDTLDGKMGRDTFAPHPLPLTKKSIAGYVAVTGKFLNIRNVYEISRSLDYSLNPEFDKKNNYQTRSMLVIPMEDNGGEVIGVLQLINSLDSNGHAIPFAMEYEDLISSLASQAAVFIRNAKLIENLKKFFDALVRCCVSAIDARSPHTAGHSKRVAGYVVRIARAINQKRIGKFAKVQFTPEEIEELNYAAWLHDVGKVGVRENILEKVNRLSDDQFEVIKVRFNEIKFSIQNKYIQKKFDLLKNNVNDESTSEELDNSMQHELKDVDEDLEFISSVNKLKFLNHEKGNKLRKVSRKIYQNYQGKKRTFLTKYEYHHLSIKSGNLTEEEFHEIQSHVAYTSNIIDDIPFTKNFLNIPVFASAHHEMLNGTGYPKKLHGVEIPLQSRILTVADVFDALIASDRPYKKAVSPDRAIEILKYEAKNGRLDQDIVDIFIEDKLYESISETMIFPEF